MDKEMNLRVLGRQVVQLFSDCCVSDSETDTENDLVRQNIGLEKDRFDLWAVNMGIFLKGHASLDYRLRNADSLRHTIYEFLKSLSTALSEVMEYILHRPEDDENESVEILTDEEDDEPPREILTEEDLEQLDSAQDLILDSIKDSINRLYKVSIWIRSPSSRMINPKALRHTQVDEETKIDWLKAAHVFDIDFVDSVLRQYRFRGTVTLHSSSDDSDLAADDSWLRDRIVRCIHDRRQLFSYWHKHHLKLKYHSSVDLESKRDAPKLQALPIRSSGLINPLAPSVMHTVTTATNLDTTKHQIEVARSTVSVSEYAPSMMSSSAVNEKTQFPPPPSKSVSSEDYFECPYCYTLCPPALLGMRAWKAHLIHDLRPYICTYKECLQPYYMYDSIAEWVQHENSHQQAAIDPPEESDRPCPVCLGSVSTSRGLQNHLARHLERFALFSLPRIRRHEDDHQSSNQAAAHSDESNESTSTTSATIRHDDEVNLLLMNRIGSMDVGVGNRLQSIKARVRRKATETAEPHWVDKGDGWCVANTIVVPTTIKVIHGASGDLTVQDLGPSWLYAKLQDTILAMIPSSKEVVMVLEFYEQHACDSVWKVIAETLPVQPEDALPKPPQETESEPALTSQISQQTRLNQLIADTKDLQRTLSYHLGGTNVDQNVRAFIAGLNRLRWVLTGHEEDRLSFGISNTSALELVASTITEIYKCISQLRLYPGETSEASFQTPARRRFQQWFNHSGRWLLDRLDLVCQYLEAAVLPNEVRGTEQYADEIRKISANLARILNKLAQLSVKHRLEMELTSNIGLKPDEFEDYPLDNEDNEKQAKYSEISRSDHSAPDWLFSLFDESIPSTPFRNRNDGEISKLFVNDSTERQSETLGSHVSFFFVFDNNIRISINRSDIVCTQQYNGHKGTSYCRILDLEIYRTGRVLSLYLDRGPSQATSLLWARLRFEEYERMILFSCAVLALQQGSTWNPIGADPMTTQTGEFELFQFAMLPHQYGFLDSSSKKILQVLRDRDSDGVRLQLLEQVDESVKWCPIWTAFINHKLGDNSWLSQDATDAKRVYCDDLVLYLFQDNPTIHSTRDKRCELLFSELVAARKFVHEIGRLERSNPP